VNAFATSVISTASTAAIRTVRAERIAACGVRVIEDINNYLLQHKDVVDLIERRGGKPVATFLMFDEKPRRWPRNSAWRSGSRPPSCARVATTRWKTVRIGNKAGVYSVPNALERVESYAHLMQIATRAPGKDW